MSNPSNDVMHTEPSASNLYADLLASSSSGLLDQFCRGKNEEVILIGGMDCPQSVVKYNIKSKEFTKLPDTNVSRCYASAVHYQGSIYLMGGKDFRGSTIYDSVETLNLQESSLKWEINQTSMNVARSDLALTLLNDRIYCVGGEAGARQRLSSVNYYDPKIGKWFESKQLNEARDAHALVSACGMLFAIGGWSNRGPTNSAVCFDPKLGEWRNISSMKEIRYNPGAVVLNDEIYVIGGRDEDENFLSTVEKYNLDSDQWSDVASLNEERWGLEACVVDNRIYAFGGYSCENVEIYNPDINEWKIEAEMDQERFHVLAVAI